MKLSDHFSVEELERSATALERGIDNTAPQDVLANLTVLAEGLERVRTLLGHPLHINSGYRCPELNAAVHGSATSAHMEGYAADFTCEAFGSPLAIVHQIVASGMPFDQCIQEGTWVHISYAPELRQRVMTAHFDANGNASYTAGA